MKDEIRIGAHSVSIEVDVVHFKLSGALSPQESLDFHQHAAAALAACGRLFILLDYRNGTHISSETRRCVAAWNKTHRVTAVAVYGVNAVTRAVATLLSGAVAQLRGEPLDVSFLKNEEAARAWIDEKRSQLVDEPS